MHGNGHFVWANGDAYHGDWLNGRMHGMGTKIMANQDTYHGVSNNNREISQRQEDNVRVVVTNMT